MVKSRTERLCHTASRSPTDFAACSYQSRRLPILIQKMYDDLPAEKQIPQVFIKFLALELLFLILCTVMWLQGATKCEKWVCNQGTLICIFLQYQRNFGGCHCICLPFNHQPISFCPERPQAYVIKRMCKPCETTSNRRGVLCPGMPAAPTEWNMLKHFLRKSGESNQASSTSQLCASSGFLVLLVNKLTNTGYLSFKNCVCKSVLCLYHGICVDADVVL